MKKAFTFTLILTLILAQIFAFSACDGGQIAESEDGTITSYDSEQPADNAYDISEPKSIIGRMLTGYVYGDYYFFVSEGNILYQHLDDIQETPLNIYSDPLATGDDNPFGYAGFSFILVDEALTAENDGYPVLLFAHINLRSNNVCYQIFLYDLKTNKITMIKDKIRDNVQSLCLYGDYIIYTTNEGDDGYNIHRVMKDGSGYMKLENPENELYRVIEVYDDRVYFYDGALQVYSMSLDFDDVEYVLSYAGMSDPFIRDGYIYYPQYVETIEFENDVTGEVTYYPSCNLCRSSISNPSESEVLINNFYSGMFSDNTYFYYLANPYVMDCGVDNYGSDVLYSLDFATGETKIVYDEFESDVLRYIGFASDDYIIFEDCYVYEGGSYGPTFYTARNLKTGEEFNIPF